MDFLRGEGSLRDKMLNTRKRGYLLVVRVQRAGVHFASSTLV